MVYSHEVEHMCVVKKGPNHGPAPIPEEGKWVKAKEVIDISGLTHGIGWCKERCYSRGIGRDHRLFGYDPLGRYGIGNPSG